MKKVMLVGYAWSKENVNWDLEDTEYWIMNDMYDVVPKFDRLFDIHDDEDILNRKTRREGLNHFESLKAIKKPVYMQREWKEIPSSVKFPLGTICNNFHIPAMGDKLFTTCSVAYMLALAILENFREISLYGIDEAIDDEYKDEMPSVLYWLGLASGRGIKINITEHSPLLKGYFLYGYEEKKRKQINVFFEEETKRIEAIKESSRKNQEYFKVEENKCIGAAAIMQHFKKLMNDI